MAPEDADAEAREPVVPGDPGLVFGLESIYGALGEGEFDLGHAFCRVFHGYPKTEKRGYGGIHRTRDKRGGWTPLHLAAWFGKSRTVVQALLDAGADPEAKDDTGRTPWHYLKENSTLRDFDPRTATVSCEDWNTAPFFERASAEDVSRCLNGGMKVNARDKTGASIRTGRPGGTADMDGPIMRESMMRVPMFRSLTSTVVPGLVLSVLGAPVLAAERVALTIDNGSRVHVFALVNPIDKAADFGASPGGGGFNVVQVEDTGYPDQAHGRAEGSASAALKEPWRPRVSTGRGTAGAPRAAAPSGLRHAERRPVRTGAPAEALDAGRPDGFSGRNSGEASGTMRSSRGGEETAGRTIRDSAFPFRDVEHRKRWWDTGKPPLKGGFSRDAVSETLARALSVAEKVEDERRPMWFSSIAVAHAETGNFRDALAIADRIGECRWRAEVFTRIGAAQKKAGEFRAGGDILLQGHGGRGEDRGIQRAWDVALRLQYCI